MHNDQTPRRRRNQSEIDQLVGEFRTSGLSQHEFAQKIGVHRRLFGASSEKLPIEDRQLALIDEVFDHPEPITTQDVVLAFSKMRRGACCRFAGPVPGQACRWLGAWLFGGSAGKIQRPDRLQKSG
jgi:hypothetical protein